MWDEVVVSNLASFLGEHYGGTVLSIQKKMKIGGTGKALAYRWRGAPSSPLSSSRAGALGLTAHDGVCTVSMADGLFAEAQLFSYGVDGYETT